MKVSQHWIQEVQHGVFRVVSLVFSLITAHAIYWFFSALNGVDFIQPYVTVATSLGFALLGYFVTRGLAHRLMNKKPVRSYLLIGVLYVFVEVACNYGESTARYPDMHWIGLLHGWQLGLFSIVAPIVLSIIPLFNLGLAYIDMDLMQEKQRPAMATMGVPGASGMNLPRPTPMPTHPKQPMSIPGAAATMQPGTSYPPMPAPAAAGNSVFGGVFNGLGRRP